MSKQYSGWMAYDASGKLIMVGGGKALKVGANIGTRFVIARVETVSFKSGTEVLNWTVEQSKKIAR